MEVHQCARFQINPKHAHENAVIRIVRYLIGTRDKGIIIKPNNDLNTLHCYVDADFCGAYNKDDCEDPSSTRSRTGYIIKYADCTITWASRLQTLTALSTTEAEYIAIST